MAVSSLLLAKHSSAIFLKALVEVLHSLIRVALGLGRSMLQVLLCVYTLRVAEVLTGDIVEEVRVNNTMDNDTMDLVEVDTEPLTPDTTYLVTVQAASVSVYRSVIL